MSNVDIFLLIVLAVFGVRSMMKGLIGQIMSIGGFVVGYLCARLFGPRVGEMLFGGGNKFLAETGGYLVVFVLVLVAAWGLSFVLKVSLSKTPVKWVDRAGGFLYGFLLGAFILGFILLAFKSVDLNVRKMKLKSPTSKMFETSVLPTAIPRFTVCLVLGELKTCDALKKPVAAVPAAPRKKAP